MRGDSIYQDLLQLLHQRPFEPFLINFENGDRALVEHPENVAFDPTGKSRRLYILTTQRVFMSTVDAVTSVMHQDHGQPIGS